MAEAHDGAVWPTTRYERELVLRGFQAIAGVDEVGRGPLAGPVMAGAVILPARLRGRWTRLIRDSKLLTPEQRAEAYDHLVKVAICHAVGGADSFEIDQIGIVAATRRAMARAIDSLDVRPDHLLIDAVDLPSLPTSQTSIIKGDMLCRSIAAASIIAKVTRDRLMQTVYESRYPGYGFASHKGYGTPEHLVALARLGPCAAHRRTFEPVRELLVLGSSGGQPGSIGAPEAPIDVSEAAAGD
jgi:ribonuclease HII